MEQLIVNAANKALQIIIVIFFKGHTWTVTNWTAVPNARGCSSEEEQLAFNQ